MDILRGLNHVDEGLLAEAAREEKRRRVSPAAWGCLAACAALAALLLGPGLAQLPRGPVKHINTDLSVPAGTPGASVSVALPGGEENPPLSILPGTGEAGGPSGPVTLPGGEENPPPSVLPETGEAGGASVLPWPGGEEDPPPSVVPWPGEGGAPVVTVPLIVEDYESSASACYATPKNGTKNLSIPLREAMEAYGRGAEYRVAMQLFADERPLDLKGPEAAAEIGRLRDLGYSVTYEEAYRDGELSGAAVTLCAAWEQLTGFPVSPDLGTMFFLYREIFR